MEGAKMLKAMVAITMAAMLFESVSARNITVGGSTGWDLNTILTQWSYSTPIFVNDSLLFIYTPAHVLIEVSESDFRTCDRTSPIGAYNNADGETLIKVLDPNYTANQPDNRGTDSDEPKEVPPNSSDGIRLLSGIFSGTYY